MCDLNAFKLKNLSPVSASASADIKARLYVLRCFERQNAKMRLCRWKRREEALKERSARQPLLPCRVSLSLPVPVAFPLSLSLLLCPLSLFLFSMLFSLLCVSLRVCSVCCSVRRCTLHTFFRALSFDTYLGPALRALRRR